jgi:hypothetical protein
MTDPELSIRERAIRTAVDRAYQDAELAPPSAADTSKVVRLQRLVAYQGLTPREHARLTRSRAADILGDLLRHRVEIPGAGVEQLSGYLYATSVSSEILVNQDDPVTRRRFTVAHELGHFLLHALPLLDDGASVFSEAQPGLRSTDATGEFGEEGQVSVLQADLHDDADGATLVPDPEAWEREANQFAAQLLMPADLCRALVSQFGPKYGDRREVLAKRLASELLVSQQAMVRRLADLVLGVA